MENLLRSFAYPFPIGVESDGGDESDGHAVVKKLAPYNRDNMSLGGNIIPIENLAESLQVAHEAGAKIVLLPMASVSDIPTIPGELFDKFQTSFCSDPRDAVFKALGVEWSSAGYFAEVIHDRRRKVPHISDRGCSCR